jgi:hypothetical protein
LILSILAAFQLDGVRIDALGLVPRFYALVVAGLSFAALRHHAGVRAAWLWLALFLASPVMHEMATSAFPEMVELALIVLGGVLFLRARSRERGALGRFALAGAAIGLAVLTRETAAVVGLLLAGWLIIERRGVWPLAALAAGAIAVIGADWLWLWSETGDPLYRVHVDSAHTLISSAHMKGGTFHGSPFFNPALAAQWLPAGPAKLHWTINPLLDFLIDPRFGLVIAAWIIADWRLRPHSPEYRALRLPLIAAAIATYVMVCWVFTLRPQPRYFLLVAYAAMVAVAVTCAPALGDPRRRNWVRIALGVLLVAGATKIILSKDEERYARQLLPYFAAHPGTYHVEPKNAARLKSWIRQERLAVTLTSAPPAIGALRLAIKGTPPPDAAGAQWVVIDRVPRLERNWLRGQPFRPLRDIPVERRVR